jgi:hypothetical protein
MLIDDQGDIIPSPIVESVQIRHFNHGNYAQNFYEFQLHQAFLFTGVVGGLQPGDMDILLFHSVGDAFKATNSVEVSVTLPNICFSCHGSGGFTKNIISYSRRDFPLPGSSEILSEQKPPVLIENTPELEAQTVVTWKQNQPTWQALKALWSDAIP